MKTQPIWNEKSLEIHFSALEHNIEVDVAIIGAGITGISTAELLKKRGLKIAILESRKVGMGTSGQSTGNLYTLTEYPNNEIQDKYDLETVKKILESRRFGLEVIRKHVEQLNIDCDFQ